MMIQRHLNNPWGNSGGSSGNGSGGGGNPWGSGGGGGPKRPFGPGNGGGPKDIDELIRQLQTVLRPYWPNRGDKKRGLLLALMLVGLLWLVSGLYRVQPDQQGVVLRFGEYVRTTQPGLRFHIPYPVETVLKPQVTRENRLEIGFRSPAEARRNTAGRSDNAAKADSADSLMLTGDENIVAIDFTVLWRIQNAESYLFRVRRPDIALQMIAESAMREVIGQTPIQNALTEGRARIEQDVQTVMQRLLDEYQSGITVSQIQLQAVDPPSQVVDAFNEVQRARADKERLRNEAEGYRNDIIPRARGDAAKLSQDAAAYREQVINAAKGDAERYLAVYNAYKSSREVTRERMYLETMEQVLKNAHKIVVDPTAGNGVMPYLPLNGLGDNKANSAAKTDTKP
jgi:membrane protease subunit HflK